MHIIVNYIRLTWFVCGQFENEKIVVSVYWDVRRDSKFPLSSLSWIIIIRLEHDIHLLIWQCTLSKCSFRSDWTSKVQPRVQIFIQRHLKDGKSDLKNSPHFRLQIQVSTTFISLKYTILLLLGSEITKKNLFLDDPSTNHSGIYVHTSKSTFKLFSSCPNSKFNQICSTPINRLDSLADPKPSQTKTLVIWSIETTTKRSLSEQPRSCFFFLVVLRCIEWGRVKILKGYKCCIREGGKVLIYFVFDDGRRLSGK